MAKPRKTAGQRHGKSAASKVRAGSSGESLGEELLREASEGQNDFILGWKQFMDELGIKGKPIGARKLREMLLREGVKPEDNEFSRAIIAMREE